MSNIPETVEAENSKFQLLDWGLLLGAAGIWGSIIFLYRYRLGSLLSGSCYVFPHSIRMHNLMGDSHTGATDRIRRPKNGYVTRGYLDGLPIKYVPHCSTVDQFLYDRNAQ